MATVTDAKCIGCQKDVTPINAQYGVLTLDDERAITLQRSPRFFRVQGTTEILRVEVFKRHRFHESTTGFLCTDCLRLKGLGCIVVPAYHFESGDDVIHIPEKRIPRFVVKDIPGHDHGGTIYRIMGKGKNRTEYRS